MHYGENQKSSVYKRFSCCCSRCRMWHLLRYGYVQQSFHCPASVYMLMTLSRDDLQPSDVQRHWIKLILYCPLKGITLWSANKKEAVFTLCYRIFPLKDSTKWTVQFGCVDSKSGQTMSSMKFNFLTFIHSLILSHTHLLHLSSEYFE